MFLLGGTRIDDSKNLRADKSQTTLDAVLTSGAADFGAFSEIIAETGIKTNWVTIYLHDNNTANEYLVETAVGPLGAEVPAIEGILYHTSINPPNITTLAPTFKVEMPKGVRVSARVKAVNNTDTVKIKCVFQGTD